MPGADVRIMKREDPGPLFPEVVEAGFMQILPESDWKVALIEGGMASGNPSVALAIPTPDGRPEAYVIVETSLAILTTILEPSRGRPRPPGVRDPGRPQGSKIPPRKKVAEAFVMVALDQIKEGGE